MSTQRIEQPSRGRAAQTVFMRLGLTSEELRALKRQGFVSQEARSKHTTVFKLRFRLNGRQNVRYLGTDPEQARLIKEELRQLQRARQIDAQLRTLTDEARRVLRAGPEQLESLVRQAGFMFHGRMIRCPRKGRKPIEQTHP